MPFRNATHRLPQRKTKKAHPKAGFSISKLTESYSPFLALQMLILATPELQIRENGGLSILSLSDKPFVILIMAT